MLDRTVCEPFIEPEDFALRCTAAALTSGEDLEDIILNASSILAMLSGWTVFGRCSATVRPIGVLRVQGCMDAIPLQWPVRYIQEVKQDGVVVDPATYAIMDDWHLVRLANPGTVINEGWICAQSLDLPTTELNTLEISYVYGTDIPRWAKEACYELGCELLKEEQDPECLLPATIRSLSIPGANYSFDDAEDEIREAATEGRLKKVARFLSLTNPDGIRVPSDVWSPDMPSLHILRSPLYDYAPNVPITTNVLTDEVVTTFSVSGDVALLIGSHRFYVEETCSIKSVRASVGTAPTGASLIVDLNKNGTTVFTDQADRPTIAAGTFTDLADEVDVADLAAGDYLTVDIDQVGSGASGANLTVVVFLTRTLD